MDTLAERVKHRREALGMSMRGVCDEIQRINPEFKTTPPSINLIEKGQTKHPAFIEELAIALGVKILWLKTGQGDMQRTGSVSYRFDHKEHIDRLFAGVLASYRVMGLDDIEGQALLEIVQQAALEPPQLKSAPVECPKQRVAIVAEYETYRILRSKRS